MTTRVPFSSTEPTSKPIRLLLVDDHAVLRAGLANVLNFDTGLAVVAEADDGEAAIIAWREHQPDLMLLDLSMPAIDGIETLQRLTFGSSLGCWALVI